MFSVCATLSQQPINNFMAKKSSSLTVDLPFKHKTLSRRTSVAIIQGHNVVNKLCSQKNESSLSLISLPDVVASAEFGGKGSTMQYWYKVMETASGTTASEIEVTQSRVLKQETELMCMWSAQARQFALQESNNKLIKAADQIMSMKRRTQSV